MLELVGLGSNPDGCAEVARRTGGSAYSFHPTEGDRRPYSAVVRAVTDDIESVAAVADVGLYVTFGREVKRPKGPHPRERVIATFGMVAHPDLTHRQADDHWRDVHGPLAVRMHAAMCDYTQLSVVATLSGLPLDGIALCAFGSREILRKRFFNDDAARAIIQSDVASFADTTRSLRRVVVSQTV